MLPELRQPPRRGLRRRRQDRLRFRTFLPSAAEWAEAGEALYHPRHRWADFTHLDVDLHQSGYASRSSRNFPLFFQRLAIWPPPCFSGEGIETRLCCLNATGLPAPRRMRENEECLMTRTIAVEGFQKPRHGLQQKAMARPSANRQSRTIRGKWRACCRTQTNSTRRSRSCCCCPDAIWQAGRNLSDGTNGPMSIAAISEMEDATPTRFGALAHPLRDQF